MRSATAPDMIVQDTPANPTWKNQNTQTLWSPGKLESQKLSVPTTPCHDVPNIRAKPTRRKTMAQMQKSRNDFMTMLIVFFARHAPISSMTNPACMKNTMEAVTTIQTSFTFN